MHHTLNKIYILAFLFVLGCAGNQETPEPEVRKDLFEDMHPEERHVWLPPSRAELDERRRNQKWLDEVTADLERLFMGHADLFAEEILLENLLSVPEAELRQMEAQLNEEAASEENEQAVRQALDEIEGEVKELDTQMKGLQKEQAARAVRKQKQLARKKARKQLRIDEYRQAILLFRNGQYLKSIEKFESLLGKKYPARLKDNILFGLASNHFRLKQYEQSLAFLTDIIQNHRKGDKWLVSHAVSGMIYSLQGRNSQAIHILETALKHKPKPKLRKMIQRLLEGARKGTVDASS